MVNRPGVITAVALLLVIGGVASIGWGYYSESTCETGVGVHVQQVDGDETPPPDFETVHFEDLSEAEQEVFVETSNAETSPTYQNRSVIDGLEQKIVVYRSERYRVSPMWVRDCPEDWLTFLFGGSIVAFLGGTLVAYRWRRARSGVGKTSS